MQDKTTRPCDRTAWKVACFGVTVFALLAAYGFAARGQQTPETPVGWEGATVQNKPGAQVPLDIAFVDEAGQPVTLRQFFKPGHPVVLNLVYFGCPMLCGLTLQGEVAGIKPLKIVPGREFEIVTISFDPREKPPLAAAKKANYIKALGKPEAAAGWHFLTGTETSARAVADAVGFGYKINPANGQYLHQSAIYICRPDGKVSRIIGGVQFDPSLMQNTLSEASAGRIPQWDGPPPTGDVIAFDPANASLLLRAGLCCGLYRIDPRTGQAVANPWAWAGTIGGGLTIAALALFIGSLWVGEFRRHKAHPEAPA